MDRNFARAHAEIGYVLVQLKRHPEAVSEFQQSLGLDKDSTSALAGLGHAHAVSGQAQQAREVLAQLKELSGRRYVSPYYLAVVHAGLGEKEQALEHLEKASQERFNWLAFLKVEPQFAALRAEPRFSALVQRIGLSP